MPPLLRYRYSTYRNYEFVERLGKSVRECHISILWLDDVPAGKLYQGRNLSFIETDERAFRVEYHRNFFRPPDFGIFDHGSGEYIGSIEIAGRTGFIYLPGTAFSLQWERDKVRIFRPSTWKKPDRYDMSNSEVMIQYHRKPDTSVSIECNMEGYYAEMLLGVFAIGEIIRRRSPD